MKICLLYQVPADVQERIAPGLERINESIDGELPTWKGMPLHVTLRAPHTLKDGEGDTLLPSIKALLSEMPPTEGMFTGVSLIQGVHVVMADVSINDMWQEQLNSRLVTSGFGLGTFDNNRQPHVTLLTGIYGKWKQAAAVSLCSKEFDWLVGEHLPIDSLSLYARENAGWTLLEEIPLNG